MSHVKFKPFIDKLFWSISIPTVLFLTAFTVAVSIHEPVTLFFSIPIDLFVSYFLVSPLFGYAELRESSLFIKYGFFIKKEIPYSKIRGAKKVRKWYSDSMLSLKNSLDHVNVKYNTFDMTSISVKDNDAFIEELMKRI